jgi:hypothetical protein
MKLLFATVWILIGSAITAGVYWLFLITPESTVWTLIASALLAFTALLLAGFTASGAIAIWSYGASAAGIRRAARAIPAAIPAALIVWGMGWLATFATNWVAMRSGPINAWFIAQFGWDDVSWLFTIVRFTILWLRWVLAAELALSLIAGVVLMGWPALAQAGWLKRALRPRTLAVVTLWAVVLIALPWAYVVPWRPRQLPASSIEFIFIVAKLSVSAIVLAIGAALIAKAASEPPAASVGEVAPARAETGGDPRVEGQLDHHGGGGMR